MRTPARIAAVLATAAGCAATAPPAVAADACPNAAARAQQVGGTLLPECRAYEMVSPVDKSGAPIRESDYVTADGTRVAYRANNAFGGSLSGIIGDFVSERTAAGWTTEPRVLPFAFRAPRIADITLVKAMSEDLSRMIFDTSYPYDPQDQGVGNQRVSQSPDLYRREADGSSTWLTPRVTLPDTSLAPAVFVDASRDLSRVAFYTNRQVTTDMPDESAAQMYLYVDGRPTTLVSRGVDGTPVPDFYAATSGTTLPGAVSDDGSRVLFHTRNGNAETQLFLREHADDPARATTVDLNGGTGGRTCTDTQLYAFSADGKQADFTCANQLTDDPLPPSTAGYYRRDLDTGAVTRIDPPTPPTPTVFTTVDALVPGDQNGVEDVYATIDGAPRLISSGTNPAPSELTEVSPDGSIFFLTSESHVPQDTDGGIRDLYVARVGGGFPVPETPPACVVNCQGPAPAPPVLPTVATVAFTGSGNLEPEVRPVVTRISTAKAKSGKGAAASITVRVPGKGRVLVSGSGLQLATKAVGKAGSVKLTVRLTAGRARTLRRSGRVKTTATVRFEAADGPAQTAKVALTFTRAKQTKTKGGR